MSTLKKINKNAKSKMIKSKTNKISQLSQKSHKSHMSSRKVSSISIGVGLPNKSWYKYPFDVIREWCNINVDIGIQLFCVNDIFTPIIGQKETFEDAGDFPNNISKYIWGEEGENDFVDWILLCKLSNGKYAYYTAWCDYTGFDCRGGMKLYISSKIQTLVKMAMDDKNRSKYLDFIKQK